MAEKGLDATILLEEIATAFEQYDKPELEVEEIRKHLFHGDAANPEQNQGQLDENLKAEYLEAVGANAEARRRFVDATTSASSQAHHTDPSPRSASDKASFLHQHLDLLRLRKQHVDLTILQDEMNAILSSSSLASIQFGIPAIESVAATNPSENGQGELVRSITQSIQALEVAVVCARHEATQQKALLDRAKSSSPRSENAPGERHFAAMSVVRRILTTWLQESLDRCQEAHDVLDDQDIDDALPTGEDWEKRVEIQYDQYVEARRQLLSAAANLSAPLPEKESKDTGGKTPVEQSSKPPATEIANAVERCLLPFMQQQRMSYSNFTFMDEQLQKESTTTVNMLDRLSDESQLLQAFPLLARSGRFVHATSTFGDNQKQDTGADKEDKVSKRLEPWMFAADAADVASSGAIEKHLNQGREAMEEVKRGLAALQLLKGAGT